MRELFIFSEQNFDILAEGLPDARVCRACDVEYLAVRDSVFAVWRLAKMIDAIMDREQACGLVYTELAGFLAENNYIHVDAFINICLEGIA